MLLLASALYTISSSISPPSSHHDVLTTMSSAQIQAVQAGPSLGSPSVSPPPLQRAKPQPLSAADREREQSGRRLAVAAGQLDMASGLRKTGGASTSDLLPFPALGGLTMTKVCERESGEAWGLSAEVHAQLSRVRGDHRDQRTISTPPRSCTSGMRSSPSTRLSRAPTGGGRTRTSSSGGLK